MNVILEGSSQAVVANGKINKKHEWLMINVESVLKFLKEYYFLSESYKKTSEVHLEEIGVRKCVQHGCFYVFQDSSQIEVNNVLLK